MKSVIQKVTAAGAIFKNRKILIVQRAANDDLYPGLWELPGGKKEPLEPAGDSVVREVWEETGIKVKVEGIVFVFNFTVEKTGEIWDFTQLVFVVKPVGKVRVKISDEHQDFRWISESELDDYRISKEMKAAIRKAFLYIAKKRV